MGAATGDGSARRGEMMQAGYGIASASNTAKPLSYDGYLKVPELTSLQHLLSHPPHHDETLFIIIHQAYELWFKLILHELDATAGLLVEAARLGARRGWRRPVRKATFYVRRVVAVQKLLVQQIHLVETMSPIDFLGFRSYLNPASGFQSGQFREIEIAGGLRDPRLITHFANEPEVAARLEARWAQPSLADHLYNLLRAHGYDLPVPPADASAEAVEAAEERRLQSLAHLFDDDEANHALIDLTEALLEFDEWLTLWRMNHLQVVERMIGFKRGTGGSEGVGYLVSTLPKRCFPDLWKVRTYLTA
jgi:tryptophan 2,3-dioxygenase